jgi:ubiquinone biosynthesis protein UbiJ
MNWTEWTEVAVVPALSALFWWLWQLQSQLTQMENDLASRLTDAQSAVADKLSDFKLDVAKNYASNQSLRETESRLVAHLNRIEAKLDWREHNRRGDDHG